MNNIKPKFLENVPKGEDLFEGKSQEKIAEVIMGILENGSFQIIGIDGGWGTGKSNLVKIIQNKLKNFKFFIYDVWGHQEDDQRKAILVELTEFISSNNVVSKKKWADKLKRLLSKEKEVTTINRPYLSVGFIFSLFSIIYVPTINVFKDSLVDFFGIKSIFWKLILVLFPIAIVIGIYLYNLIKFWAKKKGFKKSFVLAAQDTFQVYTNKQSEETKIETISENEPSVKDFRGWMKEIDSDLGSNKLILVFDNFDRLPKKNILSIWSSIHIFFSEEKYNNIKVIIPFDRLHIKNAFKELNGSDNSDYANDYINKTFDLVYRVSSPMLSDWKTFFKGRWEDAFGTVDEGEYIRVEQIYEVYRNTITPREIIAFINEVVSIKLLDRSIPDRYIALFVINKDAILSDPLKAIIDSDFLAGLSYKYKDDEDFQKYITALAYQINPLNALDVVYRKQLKDCLINKDIESFSEISRTSIFSKIVFPVLGEIENFENPILVFDSMTEDAKITNVQKGSLWSDLYGKIKKLGIVDFQIKEYQRALAINIEDSDKKMYLSKVLSGLLYHPDFEPVFYSRMVDEMRELIREKSFDINLDEYLNEKKVPVSDFILFVKDRKKSYQNYKITCEESDLDTNLSNLNLEDLGDTGYVESIIPYFKFPKYEKSLRKKIETYKSDYDSLCKIFAALKPIAKNEIGSTFTDAQIYELFSDADEKDDFYYDLVAMRLAKGPNFNSSYQSSFDEVTSLANEDIINRIIERIEHFISIEDFLLNSIKYEGGKLYKATVREILNTDYGQRQVAISSLLEVFEKICVANDLDPQNFMNRLDSWGSIDIDMILAPKLSKYYYQNALDSNTKLATNSINSLSSFFGSLNKEEWVEIFSNLNAELFQLIKVIKFQAWSSFALEALKEFLISTVNSTKIENSSEITSLMQLFEDSGRDLTNTFKDIRDEFISKRSINPNLFLLFQKWLFKYAALEERAGEVIRTIFKTSLLDDSKCVDSFCDNIDVVKLLLGKSNESDSSDFKDAIRIRNGAESIGKLANLLGIEDTRQDE